MNDRATFKLSPGSQGAPLSNAELEHFRTGFRQKREQFFDPFGNLDFRIILVNRAYLRAYMQRALDNMVYYRGDVKLSVQLGTHVLFQ